MIVGRKEEIAEIEKLYNSDRPEFVAIYGRRRVGKTFLVKQALKGRITFQHTGVSPVDQDSDKSRMKTQLESFYYTLLNHGLEGYKAPRTWMEAFFLLEQHLQNVDNVVNLCEMKFASTPYSISKEEEMRLRHRIEVLKATLSPKQTIHLTMITTFGVAYGKHSGVVQKEVTMADLF